jgi:hypothetical protein
MITLLAIALVALFIAAIVKRNPAPVTPKIPDALLRTGGGAR